MRPVPEQMRDRWSGRPQPDVDQGVVYWHILMRDHPEAQDAVSDAQDTLSAFSGFHLPPQKWLHATVTVVGSTETITRDDMRGMLTDARAALRSVAPVPVTIGRVLYHPEAVMLRLDPREGLLPIFDAVARFSVSGEMQVPSTWTPHVTVAYSMASQPAGPIVAALGKTVRQRQILVSSVSLVVQWGPERAWNWEPVGAVRLGELGGDGGP